MNDNTSIHMDINTSSKSLYIFFGGIANGIAMPPFEFYKYSKIMDCSKIFLRDLKQSWYHLGLKDKSKNIVETKHIIENLIRENTPEHLTFVGNSMGGFAAILFANLIGQGRVVAFAPQTFISPSMRWKARDARWKIAIYKTYFKTIGVPKFFDLREVLSSSQVPTDIYFSATDSLDTKHAKHLEHFKNVRIHEISEGGHGVVKTLRDRGMLSDILACNS